MIKNRENKSINNNLIVATIGINMDTVTEQIKVQQNNTREYNNDEDIAIGKHHHDPYDA